MKRVSLLYCVRATTIFLRSGIAMCVCALVPVRVTYGSGSTGQGGLVNPLKFSTLEAFLGAILDAIVLILFPFLVLAIVYAGFKFVTAQGKPDELAKARTAILWVFIGALVVLGAKAISIAIKATVDEIQSGAQVRHDVPSEYYAHILASRAHAQTPLICHDV